MKIPLLGTGLSGLVGSRIVELLDEYQFTDLSFSTGVDITDRDAVFTHISKSSASSILHLAAKADVDGCEKDKPLQESGAAWKINVEGTKHVVDAAVEFNKKVIYISTDFLFDGTKESYVETDTPNPINWYGVTKYEGEKLVLSDKNNLVVRISYPYRAVCPEKPDFVHSIIAQFKKGKKFSVVSDHWFTPTLIDDIAYALRALLQHNIQGIYHVVGSTCLTPFEAALEIATQFGYDRALVQPIAMKEYYKNRALRPYKLCIKNDKIISLVPMKTFHQGLETIKSQGVV